MMKRWLVIKKGVAILIVGLFCLASLPASAVAVDAAQEARARLIMAGIRCLVCQNQSIEDSNAPLARDLRILVRQQVAEGKNREEIEAFLVSRYGDWVLMSPPFNLRTLILWLFPPGLLLGALVFLWYRSRQTPQARPQPLDALEQARLDAILSGATSDRDADQGEQNR
jgi:cytochrome c-type biogenesis protein CcmH